MFMAMLQRHCQHVLDTDALAILPDPQLLSPSRLHRSPMTRAAHPAGDEPLWNESWYFDFADPQQGIGGWVRLGLIPNQNTSWITGAAVRPGHPDLALARAVPTTTGGIELTLAATEPLQTTGSGCGDRVRHMTIPAALLRR